MKIMKRLFLSLLWILIPSCVVVLFSYQGINLGGIGMVLLHAPFFYLLARTWKGEFDAPLPPAIPQDDSEEKKQYAQMRVDAFYAEIFSGQVSPYTGQPVLSEKDYRAHLSAKRKAESPPSDAQFSMGRSFSELVQEQELEKAKLNAMTKEAYAQYRVDKACAELFEGQLDPYTQKPIVCEADYRAYQRQHAADIASRRTRSTPAIPQDYETYIVCPGCGQLVPKETLSCDCGYVFVK